MTELDIEKETLDNVEYDETADLQIGVDGADDPLGGER